MVAGSCPNRGESPAMNTNTIPLILVNYFPTNPNKSRACMQNSAPLINMVNTCLEQDGKRWPNFIAVDYYQVINSASFQYYSFINSVLSVAVELVVVVSDLMKLKY